uniref:Uncharacterized protein n=1 Tax=Amphimedon queenslandica TaxID=400682 RepID=A0A1X7T263_AMPQE
MIGLQTLNNAGKIKVYEIPGVEHTNQSLKYLQYTLSESVMIALNAVDCKTLTN